MPDKTMDLKGLACPLPILKAKKALSALPKGGTLEVLATDPGSVADFTAFSEATGNALHRAQRGRRRVPLRAAAFGVNAIAIPGSRFAPAVWPG